MEISRLNARAPIAASNFRWRVAQFFEIQWWKRYLGGKEKEAYLVWKRDYWRKFLAITGVVPSPGAQVLDAGCGPAGIFMVLHEQAVDALDPLLEQYENALLHFRRADYPNVRFWAQPLENFFPETPYDLVFCLNAVNHVADLGAAFDRLSALVRPGGTLVVSVDAHNFWGLKQLFRLAPGDILHPHQLDLGEYQAALTDRGLRIERTALLKKELIFSYYLLVATR